MVFYKKAVFLNYSTDKLMACTSTELDIYFVRKIKNFLFFKWDKTVYGSSQSSDIGLYMWGKNLRNYKFMKNGREIKILETEIRELADIDKLSDFLENYE